jgi:N-acetylmuramoyl-L-alanine amidase
MPLDIISSPSPNHDSRIGQEIDMLVLHYTGMPSAQDAITRLRDSESKVSSHYVIDEDGSIHALVNESERAWHSGVSYWRGHTNINQRSVGIEIVNPGHEFGYRRFPDAQMEAVAALSKEIQRRHDIPARNIVGHSDVAPQRKEDPGELFNWPWLAQQGIGLFPEKPATHTASVENLALYGYDLSKPRFAITAFQRHFRPTLLSGEWDDECASLLAALLQIV